MLHTLASYALSIPQAFAQEVITIKGGTDAVTLPNPLGEGTTLIGLIEKITRWGFTFAIAVVPIIVVVGAFQMLTAAGNPEKFAKGQKTVLYAVIGLVIMAAATGIVSLVESLLR
jgi:hypothetical protein